MVAQKGLVCPRCQLISPPIAARCDCGYDFETKTVKASYLSPGAFERAELRRTGNRYMLAGGAIGFLGLGLAVAIGGLAWLMGGAPADARAYFRAYFVPGALAVLGALLIAHGFRRYR